MEIRRSPSPLCRYLTLYRKLEVAQDPCSLINLLAKFVESCCYLVKWEQTSTGQTKRRRFMLEGPQPSGHVFFCAHTPCMNYVIAMFVLVSCMNTRNHLLYFVRFCAGSTPKIENKNIQQRTLPGFLTISLHQLCVKL